jgi:hypothetical protein
LCIGDNARSEDISYSITLAARASSVADTVRPRALAVFKLIETFGGLLNWDICWFCPLYNLVDKYGRSSKKREEIHSVAHKAASIRELREAECR